MKRPIKPTLIAAVLAMTFGSALPVAQAGNYCSLGIPGLGCGDTSGMTDATGSGWAGPAPQLNPGGGVMPGSSSSSLAAAMNAAENGWLPTYTGNYSEQWQGAPSGWSVIAMLPRGPWSSDYPDYVAASAYCMSGYVPELIYNGSSYALQQAYFSAGCSCFPAGALVMMADGTERAIETIGVGEWLMGANGRPVQVRDVDRPILGERRMMAFADGSQIWSEEHSFWTRDAAGAEWWWSANPDQWRYEASIGHIGGLRDNSSMRAGAGFEFAHLRGGWVRREVVEAEGYGPETQLYLPRTDGVPIIVNGYVVGAGVNEDGYDYASFRWSREVVAEGIARQALARVVRRLPTFSAKLPELAA